MISWRVVTRWKRSGVAWPIGWTESTSGFTLSTGRRGIGFLIWTFGLRRIMKAIDKLRAYWDKKERDLAFHWPGGVSTKCDAHYLCSIFTEEFWKELDARGYDVTTLKFEICPKNGNERFTSQRQVDLSQKEE
jgi:hypothetical protein